MKVTPKKKLGQHFLNNQNVAKKIVDALAVESKHEVLEIGPGMGVLTKRLVESYDNLTVIEIDKESVVYLKQHMPNKFKIIEGDFLKINLETLFKSSLAIIGNFPYNISSQIVFKIIENKDLVNVMVGMFQKEVAERICAPHGNKTYGILSVLTQVFYETEYLFTVHENEFTPPPKVKSGVIKLVRKETPSELDERLLFKIVKTTFNQRRKKIRNTLKNLIQEKKLPKHPFFEKRPEQLSVANFVDLSIFIQNN